MLDPSLTNWLHSTRLKMFLLHSFLLILAPLILLLYLHATSSRYSSKAPSEEITSSKAPSEEVTSSKTPSEETPPADDLTFERLKYIKNHFSYKNFLQDPLGTVNLINGSGVFLIESVPRTLVIFIKRKRQTGFVEKLVDELRVVEKNGGGYLQRNVKRSFYGWQRSIIKEILKGKYEIKKKKREILEEILGINLSELLEAYFGDS